ncbi:MAG: hypothetical protein Tsb0034_02900 [Ekhidna sp.]
MSRDRFEDILKEKFDHGSIKAPKSVWAGVESELNEGLISQYQTSHSKYKWIAAAAVLIAACSIAFHFTPDKTATLDITSENTYNALLSRDADPLGFFQVNPLKTHLNRVIFVGPGKKTAFNSAPPQLQTLEDKYDMNREGLSIAPRSLSLSQADVEEELYLYHKGLHYNSNQPKSTGSVELWAGIEAGAGNYTTSVDGSNGLAQGVNALSLASAVGADAFRNPTTAIDPNLRDGIATSVGFDFGVKIGDKWTLESGLAYTNVDAQGTASINVNDNYTVMDFNRESGREVPRVVNENFDHEVDLRSNVRFTSFPLKAGYFLVDKKVSLRLSAGLTANYLISSQIQDPSASIFASSHSNIHSDWTFDGIGGLEFGYSIFNQFDLTIEPNYRHNLSQLGGNSTLPSSFMIQTGLRYKL